MTEKRTAVPSAPTMTHYALMNDVLADPGSLGSGAAHADWRVRYAAAVAMGEAADPERLPVLLDMIRRETERDLYSQPRVAGFEGSYDDTRMAEQLEPIHVIWDRPYPADRLEDWRCRGRVLQACLFAVEAIGVSDKKTLDCLHRLLTEGDSVVKAAAARALIRIGTRESLPFLKAALEIDEWCLQTEAAKAIRRIEDQADGNRE